MDLQRPEYPSMLISLQPTQAVQVLNDRIKHARKLNTNIADWLLERRRVEEQYAQALRKLAAKTLADDTPDLGVFSTPWKKIVSSVEALAESHHTLALGIEVDVERPLRDFANTNREMRAVPTMSGNLLSLAKDLDEANKASKKQREKGGKASADKVASAANAVENAQGQWDSQAPYVFEQLQAADESRLNHLRDALTQYQTHVIESASATSSSEEQTLNALLNVQTSDEISTFVAKAIAGQPQRDVTTASSSRPAPPVHTTSNTLAPTTSASQPDDASSHRSSSVQDRLPDRPKTGSSIGKSFGLKRLGTVMNRRKSTHPYDQALSPEKKRSTPNLSPFRRKTKDKLESTDLEPVQSLDERRLSEVTTPGSRSATGAPQLEPLPSVTENGAAAEPTSTSQAGLGLVNGADTSSAPKLQDPLVPMPSPVNRSSMVEPFSKPTTDGQGFSVPPPATDPITLAEQEAALANEGGASQPRYEVDIRNAPIAEEDADASAAMANVANTLRMSAAPRRSQGTIRGRRDGNRNTIMLSSEQAPTFPSAEPATSPPNSAPLPAAPSPSATPPVQSTTSPSISQSQFKLAHRSTLMSEEYAGSDTHSVRSGRSLSSSASSTVKHPEMHELGLNSSIVETVSAWFAEGAVTRSVLIGEVALAYNPQDFSTPFGTDSIRLNSFSELEKVAPNPTFIDAVNDSPGTYTVNLSQATKTAVAFKYQVRLEESALATYAPLMLKPAWKVEPTQASVILTYGFNPAFNFGKTSVTLSSVIIVIHLDPTGPKATSCKAMGGGTFSREKNLVYWRLGDITLSKDGPSQTLKARFFTEGEAKTGNVEARWELHKENAAGVGSGLSLSLMEHSTSAEGDTDPFADEGAASAPAVTWKDVRTVKSLRSGTYLAT